MEENHELNSIQSSSYEAVCEGRISAEEYFKTLPHGYQFSPEDTELLEQYLMKKVNNQTLPPNLIRDVQFYDYHPLHLAAQYKPINKKEWYFFSPRYKKYPNGSRPDRATSGGFWKPTGTEKPIIPSGSGNPLGYKRTLDFYLGKHPKGEATDWKMHEYTLIKATNNPQSQNRATNGMMLDTWVLCKLYNKKKDKNGDDHEGNYAATEQQPTSSIDGDDNHGRNAATTHDQQPTSVNLSMLQGINNNNNSIVASENIEVSSSNSMQRENNNINTGEFGNKAALIQPIPDQGLLHDSQMIFTDHVDPTEDNKEFWERLLEDYWAADDPSSAKGLL